MIRILGISGLLLAAAAFVGCATEDRTAGNLAEAQALLEESREAARKKDFVRALSLCTKAVKVHPDYAEAWYERGRMHTQLRLDPTVEGDVRKHEAQALEDFSMALKKNPMYGDAFFNRAMLLCSRAQYKPAAEDLLNAVRCKPRDPDAHLYLGRLYETKFEERAPLAMDHYEKYADLGGTDPEAREKARLWKDLKKQSSAPQVPPPAPTKPATAEDEKKAAELHGKALEIMDKNRPEAAKIVEELLGAYGNTKYVQEKSQGLKVLLGTLKKKDPPK